MGLTSVLQSKCNVPRFGINKVSILLSIYLTQNDAPFRKILFVYCRSVPKWQ